MLEVTGYTCNHRRASSQNSFEDFVFLVREEKTLVLPWFYIKPFFKCMDSDLSQGLVVYVLIFFNHFEEPEFHYNCEKSHLKNWARFLATAV